MNCKPGDLAVVVRGENIGVLVDVLEPHWFEEACWRVRVHSCAKTNFDRVLHRGDVIGCHDSKLRPIRDPGDDARDESLSWLPVPSREKEHA